MARLSVGAPAKLNLSLAVVGRRPDANHLLASVFVLLELADRVALTPGGSRLEVDPVAGVPSGPDNLAWRGLLAGLEAEPVDVCLAVEKRVPVTAGLGGGSSDAAAAWRLGRRWRGLGDQPDHGTLRELSRIGADVPFFAAQAAAAYVTGIGEEVTPLRPPEPRHVVLALADIGLSTAAVFGELRRGDWSAEPPDAAVEAGRNDLLAPALRLRPELADVFAIVRRGGGDPHLTGSGPTVFSVTDDPERAADLRESLEAAGIRAIMTRYAGTAATIEASTQEEGSP